MYIYIQCICTQYIYIMYNICIYICHVCVYIYINVVQKKLTFPDLVQLR